MADHGKIRGAFNDEQFEAFCEELRRLPAKERTLDDISALFGARTGIYASIEAARSFKRGPYARYLEKLQKGRDARESLCTAVGAGQHPVDAMEDMVAIELQDHFENPEGGQINIEWVISQLTKLRASISMRENSRRQQADLERKQKETAAKLEIAEQREKLLREQVGALERAKADWEKRQADALAAVAVAAKKGGITADTRKTIEAAMKGEVIV